MLYMLNLSCDTMWDFEKTTSIISKRLPSQSMEVFFLALELQTISSLTLLKQIPYNQIFVWPQVYVLLQQLF